MFDDVKTGKIYGKFNSLYWKRKFYNARLQNIETFIFWNDIFVEESETAVSF